MKKPNTGNILPCYRLVVNYKVTTFWLIGNMNVAKIPTIGDASVLLCLILKYAVEFLLQSGGLSYVVANLV